MRHDQGSMGTHQELNRAILAAALALLLATAARGSATAPAGIEEACRSAASRDSGFDYAHCVSSLSSDPQSRDERDMHALAAAATRMAIEHATATEAKMEGLGETEGSPRARARLGHCQEVYGAAADVLRDALDNIRARVYGRAVEQIAAALGAAERCEDAWKGEEEERRIPAVAAHDREYGRLATVALGLTAGIV